MIFIQIKKWQNKGVLGILKPLFVLLHWLKAKARLAEGRGVKRSSRQDLSSSWGKKHVQPHREHASGSQVKIQILFFTLFRYSAAAAQAQANTEVAHSRVRLTLNRHG